MLKIGIIGVGGWGQNLVRVFSQLSNAQVLCICDSSASRLEFIKSKYHSLKSATDYQELLEDPKIDAVVIATSAASHFQIAKDALAHGKHVFVEKPLALSSAECETLITAAQRQHLTLMVGHTFLYNPAVRKAKEYLDKKYLGEVYYIYTQRLNLGIVRRDVNAMWNFAPHDISIIMYLLDKLPSAVSAKGLSYIQENIEDVVFLNLDFTGGTSAHIHISWLDPNKTRKVTIIGSERMIVYDDINSDARIQIYDKGITKKANVSLEEFNSYGQFQLIHRAGDVLIPKVDTTEALQVEAEHFVDCIISKKKPLSDGLNGLAVVKILEAADRSIKAGGTVQQVTWR